MDQRGTGCSTAYPEDLSLRGVQRLLHYGSRAIVNDSEALRKKLLPVGTPWKVFGQSFGGRIVQRYLEIAPMGLVSAHSHGYSIMSNDYQWTALRLLSQKRVFQDYLKVYPNDEIQIFKIRKQIPDDQCFVSQATSVCGARVIDSLVLSLGFKSSWSTLHQWVENLLIKGEVLNPPVLKQLVQFYVFGIYANNLTEKPM